MQKTGFQKFGKYCFCVENGRYHTSSKTSPGQYNFYICAFPSYKNLIVMTYEIHVIFFILEWVRFEPLIPRDIL